jgi:hypothetical protein
MQSVTSQASKKNIVKKKGNAKKANAVVPDSVSLYIILWAWVDPFMDGINLYVFIFLIG